MGYRPSLVLILEVPLLTLHICVSAVIAWEIRHKHRTFSSGFYKLLVVQNTVDIVSYAMVSFGAFATACVPRGSGKVLLGDSHRNEQKKLT